MTVARVDAHQVTVCSVVEVQGPRHLVAVRLQQGGNLKKSASMNLRAGALGTDLFASPARENDLRLLVTECRVASGDFREPVVPVAVVVEELEHSRLRQVAAIHRLATTLVDEWSGVV